MTTLEKQTKRVKPESPLALLDRLGACSDAKAWVKSQKGKSLKQLWDACPRGDHLLWLSAKLNVERELVVTAACQCARLALKHVPAGETRPLKAIETAEAWVRGEATIEQVRSAYAAAYASASDAAAYAAASAAYAAASAAYAAASAAYAAASAAYAAASAAYAAARASARAKTLAECADLVRKAIPFSALGLTTKARAAK